MIGFAFKRYIVVTLPAVPEQFNQPFQKIPDIEKKISQFLDLLGVDAFVLNGLDGKIHSMTGKYYPEQVNCRKSFER